MRVDAAVLADTVARYNAGVRSGTDPEHGRPLSMARELTTPPYYGYPCRAGLTTTYCGVRVSRRLEVLDVFGQPIGGLFAAGEVVGGLHGAGYLTGTGLGKAAVYGRVAGLAAAG
jgi:fumarate reductase flavoprotein subunit